SEGSEKAVRLDHHLRDQVLSMVLDIDMNYADDFRCASNLVALLCWSNHLFVVLLSPAIALVVINKTINGHLHLALPLREVSYLTMSTRSVTVSANTVSPFTGDRSSSPITSTVGGATPTTEVVLVTAP